MTATRRPDLRLTSAEILRSQFPPFFAETPGDCLGENVKPDWWHPEDQRPRTRALWTSLAQSVCAGCPLQLKCRDWARDTQQDGIWGGETDQLRAAWLKRKAGLGRVFV